MVEFKNNSVKAKKMMKEACIAFLEEAAGEIESRTQRNSRVDTGQTKGAWTHVVDEDELIATIGNPLENALWEEFGTGEYALHGDGRKGGWFYKDKEGKGHFTHGKTPHRAFQRAYDALKKPIIQRAEEILKGTFK